MHRAAGFEGDVEKDEGDSGRPLFFDQHPGPRDRPLESADAEVGLPAHRLSIGGAQKHESLAFVVT